MKKFRNIDPAFAPEGARISIPSIMRVCKIVWGGKGTIVKFDDGNEVTISGEFNPGTEMVCVSADTERRIYGVITREYFSRWYREEKEETVEVDEDTAERMLFGGDMGPNYR